MSVKYDFTIKQGNTGPDLEVECLDEDGNIVDLSSATDPKFIMMDKETNENEVNDTATITDASSGKIKYTWSDGDTDVAGEKLGEFTVTLSSGQKVSFPNNGYIKIMIYERISLS